MSSPDSSNEASPASALAAALPGVVVSVAENGFFAWAVPCGQQQFADVAASSGELASWLHVRVAFRGAVGGALEVVLPDRLSRELGATMVGAQDWRGITDEESADVAGELTNVLCGALLTRATHDGRFNLAPPQVERCVGTAGPPALTRDDLFFAVNTHPIAVRLVVQAP